jgi:phosphinothricin acetyltransferase
MEIIDCTFAHAPAILDILNEEILHTTALYDYRPRTMQSMETWFEAKRMGAFPVLGASVDGAFAGFASYGTFRAWPAYKYSVEHSVYVHRDFRRRGIGRALVSALLEAAKRQDYHTVIGGIEATNAASIGLHVSLGFTHCGTVKQAGFKFGRWLDLAFYQYLLTTPADPVEG